MIKNPKTELTPQNLQNLSFDKTFNVLAIEALGFDSSTSSLVKIATDANGKVKIDPTNLDTRYLLLDQTSQQTIINGIPIFSGAGDQYLSVVSTDHNISGIKLTRSNFLTDAYKDFLIYNTGGVLNIDHAVSNTQTTALSYNGTNQWDFQTNGILTTGTLGCGNITSGSVAATGSIMATAYGSTGAQIIGRAAAGTLASPTATALDQYILFFGGRGYVTDFLSTSQGLFGIKAAELFTATNQGTYSTIETTAIGSTTRTEKVRVADFGVGMFPSNLPYTGFGRARLHLYDDKTAGDVAMIIGNAGNTTDTVPTASLQFRLRDAVTDIGASAQIQAYKIGTYANAAARNAGMRFGVETADTLVTALDLSSTDATITGYVKGTSAKTALSSLATSSLRFNGADGKVTISDVTELNAVTTFTYSTWLTQDSLSNLDTLFSKPEATASSNSLRINRNGATTFNVQIYNGTTAAYGTFNPATYMTAGRLHHLVAVYDGGGATNDDKLKVYIDGVLIALTFTSTIPAITNDTTGQAAIISQGTSSLAWLGNIKDTRIFSTALSAANVLALYNSEYTTSMVHQWKMTEGKGLVATDTGSNPVNGVISGGATWVIKEDISINRYLNQGRLNLPVGTTQEDGIFFGKDTWLYRSAATSLTMNGSLTVGANTAPTQRLEVTQTSAGALGSVAFLRNLDSTANTAVSLRLSPSTSSARYAEIVSTNNGSNACDLHFVTGSGATITDKYVISGVGVHTFTGTTVDFTGCTSVKVPAPFGVGTGVLTPITDFEVMGVNLPGTINLSNSSGTIVAGNILGSLSYYSRDNSTGASGVTASIKAVALIDFVGTNSTKTALDFYTRTDGGAETQKVRIDDTGRLIVSGTSAIYKLQTNEGAIASVSAVGDVGLYFNASEGIQSVNAANNAVKPLTIQPYGGGLGVGTSIISGLFQVGVRAGVYTATLSNVGNFFGLDTTAGQMAIYATDTAAVDKGASMSFGGRNTVNFGGVGNASPYIFAAVRGAKEGAANTFNGYLSFLVTDDTSAILEKARITSAGYFGLKTTAPNSTFHSAGSFATATNVLSGDTTLDATHQIVIVSALATITLPTAANITGRQYNIIRSGVSNVTIATTSSQTISGDANLVLTDQWDSVVVVSDGSNWVRCS